MNNENNVVRVSNIEWQKAQEYEKNTWLINNQDKRNNYFKIIYKFLKAIRKPKKLYLMFKYRDFYCGDDWNYWWFEQFENFKLLPESVDRSLEVGSGPYSNSRLISHVINIKEVFCTDPLMDVYKKFRHTWISTKSKEGSIIALCGKAEDIKYSDNCFDLVICINVLDHVEDAEKCLSEITRVTKPGGYLIFGQELTDDEDSKKPEVVNDVGHPIKLSAEFIDDFLTGRYGVRLKKILNRSEGRVAEHRCGTYIYIGVKA